MNNRIPNTIRTGHRTDADEEFDVNSFIQNAASFAAVFFSRASHNASTYAQHEGRRVVCKSDIVRAMKHQYFVFGDTVDMEELLEMKSTLFDSDDDEVEELHAEGEEEEFEQGIPCVCDLCMEIRESETRFLCCVPMNAMQQLFYNAIEKAEEA